MNRRDWVLGTASLAGLATLPLSALAQGAPQEGRDYKRVETPVPVPEGKVEVVEFFGYWCPHCNAFEPTLERQPLLELGHAEPVGLHHLETIDRTFGQAQ